MTKEMTLEEVKRTPDEGFDYKNASRLEMKMRDKIAAIKVVQPYESEVKRKLEKIIEEIYDDHIRCVTYFIVGDTHIMAEYESCYRGEYDYNDVNIPIEWLDEGFDYKTAYRKRKTN